MPQTILVRRKSHRRKPYTRKGGIHVRGSRVESSTFRVKDRGKPGRTPKSEQWYEPKVEMNWHKTDAQKTRRARALRAHGGDVLATARALQALANVTSDSPTEREARKDARYFFGRLK